MKVLFGALKYDYGQPMRGLSVEYTNFYDTLLHMPGIQASFYAIDERTASIGEESMNAELIKTVQEQKPDLLFCYLLTDELKKETISFITNKTSTKTFNWFADDHGRVPVFSRYWAPLFTLVSTTDRAALNLYKSYGITNVVKTQWGANPFLYQPHPGKDNYDITFVGKKFGNRSGYIAGLHKAGLPVQTYGSGWGQGRIDQQKMIEIFSSSKINLNFTETHTYGARELARTAAKLLIRKDRGRYRFDGHFASNLKSIIGMRRQVIKGRTFEVPACGGFLLTGRTDDEISEYYTPDKEIVVFENKNDLVEKCKYYLENDDERNAIAHAGYQRTLRDHTYIKRFEEIFRKMELM